MNCEQFRLAWVGDDDAERAAAERHAVGCAACAEIVQADRALLDRAREWRDSPPPPSDLLGRRISAAVTRALSAAPGTESHSPRRRPALHGWGWAAAAALLVLIVLPIARSLLTDPSPYEVNIQRADRARLDYTRALPISSARPGRGSSTLWIPT